MRNHVRKLEVLKSSSTQAPVNSQCQSENNLAVSLLLADPTKTHTSLRLQNRITLGYQKVTRVDPLTSILAVLARSCQIITTSWQPWNPWKDSY